MSVLETLDSDFHRDVARSKMLAVLHTFQIVRHPEPYIAQLTPENIEEDYFSLQEFDIFRVKHEMPRRTSEIQRYLGDIANIFLGQAGEQLRTQIVAFGDEVIDERFDGPVLIDTGGNPLTANQILPDPVLIDSTVRAARGNKPSTLLNIYFEHAIAALGDRAPQI